MAFELPEALLQDFASAVNETRDTKVERTVYASVASVETNGDVYVEIDGSGGVTTPAVAMVGCDVGDRVTVMFKNRRCVITGNASSPAITSSGSMSLRYASLPDKPSIETVTLAGDKSFEDLGLGRITNTELEEMLTL